MTTVEEIRTVNLNALIKKYGGFQAFAEKVERERSQIEQWARNYLNAQGNPRYISSKSCRRIEKILSIQDGWMDQDHSGESREKTTTGQAFTKKPDESVFDVLDIKAACGSGIVNLDHPEVIKRLIMPSKKALELIGSANRNGQIRVITATKDSMLPTIKPNDLLFVDTTVKDFKGEAIYILSHGGELVCKRLQLLGKDLTVISDNKNYDSWKWESKPEETRIIGKVIRALPLDFKIFGS